MRNSRKKSFHQESGFTLIELLIVIVVIGILAAVLIAVINPVRIQNRARNSSIRAAVLKTAFAVNTVRAGTGKLPSGPELTTEMENITYRGGDMGCTSGNNSLNCTFTVSGTKMPKNCGSDYVVPSSGGNYDCHMRLIAVGNSGFTDLVSGKFRLVAAAFNLNPSSTDYRLYVFDSSQGLLECGAGVRYDSSLPLTVNNSAPVSDTNCNIVSD